MPKHRQNAPQESPEDPITLEGEWSGLIASGRAALDSELAFQKARVGLAAKLAGRIALAAGLALALVFFALMAVVVGAVLGLSAWIGPWGATAVVMLALLLGVAAAALAVRRAIRGLFGLFRDEDAA